MKKDQPRKALDSDIQHTVFSKEVTEFDTVNSRRISKMAALKEMMIVQGPQRKVTNAQ